jgi:uncharacterized phage-associated protein
VPVRFLEDGPRASAIQLASWVVRYRSDNGAPIDPVTLQKMLYYAQAFHLARHGDVLLRERFKAWTWGPVIPQVWHHFHSNPGELVRPIISNHTASIAISTQTELKDVVDYFSRYNTFEISDATHHEDPWVEARQGLDDGKHSDRIISIENIRQYYAELLSDGEEAFSRHEALDIIPEPRLGYYYEAGICIRKMTRHPFYRMGLAEALHFPVPLEPPWPPNLFDPPTRRAYIPVDDL